MGESRIENKFPSFLFDSNERNHHVNSVPREILTRKTDLSLPHLPDSHHQSTYIQRRPVYRIRVRTMIRGVLYRS